ncbi:hypothetical protein B484DRAFT_142728 [Ochromonadaceae sp. CCMP2298]|nr:hypothetical protein B484DRAFT_142728 [Ochromonadaceae sp. CCMP2298]
MLDVTLDRSVEVSASLLTQWRARCVPSIAGMEVRLRARQELEMLIVSAELVLPPPHTFSALKRSKRNAARKDADLLDMNEYSEEEDETTIASYGQITAVEIALDYRLTSSELSIFGAAELVEKKISLSQNNRQSDQEHPETSLWNVLSRLQIFFKGSTQSPFEKGANANDSSCWRMELVRRLVREVKPVSQGVLILTASAIGGELLIEGEPLDATVYKKMGQKIIAEAELVEMVYTEGWPLGLLEYSERKKLAALVLDKLKVVDADVGDPRLEVHTYAEMRMLRVSQYVSKEYVELGSVEISYHSTLSDVRVLIKHELDVDDVPKLFRFMYKGSQCSAKQEPFRRAWECLPRCLIIARAVDMADTGVETEDIVHDREKEKKKKNILDLPKLPKGQRRVLGRWSAVPVATLCWVQETYGRVHALHAGLFTAGDIVRFGNVLGRDYIVMPTPEAEAALTPQSFNISPAYDLVEETEFSAPTQGNFPHPRRGVGKVWSRGRAVGVLKDRAQMGYSYVLPAKRRVGEGGEGASDKTGDGIGTGTGDVFVDGNLVPSAGDRVLSVTPAKGKRTRPKEQVFEDCWVWRCIPAKEDTRLKWRVQYDNGAVQYAYEHKDSEAFETHFRVKALHRYLEVLCTDSRIGALTIHAQRVDDMGAFPVDFYVQLMFDKMTDWAPTYKKGIERSKFVKLLRDTAAFPDMKRSSRVAQVEMHHQIMTRSDFGINQKYVNFAGFVLLLKTMALLRYPPPKKSKEVEEVVDGGSVGGGSVGGGSVESVGSGSDGSEVSASKSRKKKKKQFAQGKSKRRQKTKTEEEGGGEEVVEADPVYVLEVYSRFVVEQVMMYQGWYELVWEQAKLRAMRREAVIYCAATRIQAKHRGGFQHSRYVFFLKQHTKLQAIVRRRLSSHVTHAYTAALREDWCYRMRYHYATAVQALVRKFCKRCWFQRAIDRIKQTEVLVQKARRYRLKKLRLVERKGVLYKELKRVNGVMVLVRLTRKDARSYSRDCSLQIEIYVPAHQSTFRFSLDDAELRFYMGIELGMAPSALSLGDLLDKRNLQKIIACRLIVHKHSTNDNTTIVFSKHALGQRGKNTFTRGKRIKGELFVAKVFEAGDEVAVQLYHRHTCKVFNCHISVPEIVDWIRLEHRTNAKSELERYSEPPILAQENRPAYYSWILDHITTDTRRGTFKVLFTIHLLRSRKKELVTKLQANWRRCMVRPRIVDLLEQRYIKVHASSTDTRVYYLNKSTGATTWEKSKLLGSMDLTVEPSRQWVPLTYYDNNGPQTHYVNPYTGKYTHLLPERAACIIQSLVRNFQLHVISMPLALFLRAGRIFKGAQQQYDSHKRLSCVVNWAMVQHVCNLEEGEAKKLFQEAVELSEANPLVTRAYALYMFCSCEAPIKANRDRVKLLLFDAQRKDPMHDKFQVAYYLYQFGLLRHPRDHRALVNLACVQCLLYNDNYTAEKLMRRALALAPFEERVMLVWEFLKDRFPDRQLLYAPVGRVNNVNPRDGKARTVHGRPVSVSPQWAGWCFVQEDKFNISKVFKDESYWYNPADGREQKAPPDFQEAWGVRQQRSAYEGESFGLHQYFDPVTSEYFQFHALTNTYA